MKEDQALFEAYEDFIPADCAESEKRLMIAVLCAAIHDIREEDKNRQKSKQIRRDARRFFLENDSQYLFSFRNICEQLNIPQESILTALGFSDRELLQIREALDSLPEKAK